MKNYKIKFALICVVCGIILTNCKSLDTKVTVAGKEIPSSYGNTNDTNTVADINWKNYFADETLLKLIETALTNNLDLQMTLQRVQVARSGLRFSTGNMLPSVSAKGYAGQTDYAKYTQEYLGNVTTYYDDNGVTKTVPNPLNDFYVGLTASWEIDIWGKLRGQRKAALSNYLASVEGKNFVVSNLVSEISVAYYNLLALDNQLEIIQQTIQKQQDALTAVELQKEAGRVTELAVQQFEAQLLNSKALEKEVSQQITEAENKINFLLGRFPQTIERKKEILFQEVPQQISSGIPSQLLSRRPDIREAEYQLRASKFDVKAAKAAFFPNINLAGALGFQSFNAQYLFNPPSLAYSALGGLVAPLINMNALKLQFKTAKAKQITAMYNYQKAILNGYVEVVNELSNIKNLQEINALKKQQNDVLIQSVETSAELYKRGKAEYLEMLITQQNSLQTKLEWVQVSKRQKIAIVNIYKALGGGWR